ncbi:hypothetical protein [Flavobacterium hydrophilum]|uniref:Uncharacterized protein n=1 Tax=Flavobacterium hydrophilum TaxID=2211445 RepID=A0A2V4BZS5_9FLAO|nr:hypothetical protein [Flavobacterium hydrophilum]PXY44538.1 hypothetical protein DMB68_13805 [Flavobacterium hydrophilum]
MNKTTIAVIVSVLIVLTGFIETKFDLLQEVGLSLVTINRIKLIGLVLSAVLPSISKILPGKTE